MSNFKNFTLNSFEEYYGKPSEIPKMEEEKLEVTNMNASSSKKVHKSKKSTSKYDQKNMFRDSIAGIPQILPTKPVKIIAESIDFANPNSFNLLQSRNSICFNKKAASTNSKLNLEGQTSSDINNNTLHARVPIDLGSDSNEEAEIRQLRKFRWSNNKKKCLCEKLTVVYWALLMNTTKRVGKRRPILCHQLIAEFFNRVYKDKSRVPITSRYIRDNLIIWVTHGKELYERGHVCDAKIDNLQKQFDIATIELYSSVQNESHITRKEKLLQGEATVGDSMIRTEELSTRVTEEYSQISLEMNLKEDRKESIRNQILDLDLKDEGFFHNVMKILSAIDEPKLRQYVTRISELVDMQMDDGKTIREKLHEVEICIRNMHVDIEEIKDMLVTLLGR
ncbi:Srl2p [Saccharomyces cerevisiae YJM1342]|nr:Srl2p [Saccharomyces cerevisiae YJM1342]